MESQPDQTPTDYLVSLVHDYLQCMEPQQYADLSNPEFYSLRSLISVPTSDYWITLVATGIIYVDRDPDTIFKYDTDSGAEPMGHDREVFEEFLPALERALVLDSLGRI
ncbi:MAG: hypothetical protein AB7L09_02340 [Nitrospira sp.]